MSFPADTTFTDVSYVDYDPELTAALGNVMVVWAFAEAAMVMALSRLTGVGANRATTAYYRIPTFESRVKFLRSLIPDWADPAFTDANKEEIDNAIIKLSGLSRTRNHWVHSVWARVDGTTQTVVIDFRAAPNTPDRIKPIKAADIENHVRAVKQRADELYHAVRHRELPR